jgi:hypothetical protein
VVSPYGISIDLIGGEKRLPALLKDLLDLLEETLQLYNN